MEEGEHASKGALHKKDPLHLVVPPPEVKVGGEAVPVASQADIGTILARHQTIELGKDGIGRAVIANYRQGSGNAQDHDQREEAPGERLRDGRQGQRLGRQQGQQGINMVQESLLLVNLEGKDGHGKDSGAPEASPKQVTATPEGERKDQIQIEK